jgi:ribosome-associated translation inhibitor RaiA
MITTPQITMHGMPASPALEREIRERIEALETFYPDIIGCRVLVDLPHRHRERGRAFHVTIELTLPGEDVVVSHSPSLHGARKDLADRERRKNSDIDGVRRYASVAVREAFELARRRLQDFARRQRGEVKTHVAP